MKRLCDGGPEAIMGTLIVLWRMARCRLHVLFAKRGNEGALKSNTLDTASETHRLQHKSSQTYRWICQEYNLSPSPDSQEQAGPEKQMLQHRSYNTLPIRSLASSWLEGTKVPPWFKSVTTTKMTKFVILSLILKYSNVDWVLTD